ncbi:hypothetical protein LDVICp150 [lymphocystis disease virus-China]|uniref:Uncharacterized protein n=2 Tax=Lymphocystis disease virus 2 TaxID=159183 RepID=A0A6F8X1U4_9VIRU|nr:hypothetical protein LDVICp150 [lymphocystis disease virus-China]AAU10995.1 hypothetical protein [lymphocystis disease virus-China]BCB67501.1 hypothetical protein [Lymphocystis disease virus 2]
MAELLEIVEKYYQKIIYYITRFTIDRDIVQQLSYVVDCIMYIIGYFSDIKINNLLKIKPDEFQIDYDLLCDYIIEIDELRKLLTFYKSFESEVVLKLKIYNSVCKKILSVKYKLNYNVESELILYNKDIIPLKTSYSKIAIFTRNLLQCEMPCLYAKIIF